MLYAPLHSFTLFIVNYDSDGDGSILEAGTSHFWTFWVHFFAFSERLRRDRPIMTVFGGRIKYTKTKLSFYLVPKNSS